MSIKSTPTTLCPSALRWASRLCLLFAISFSSVGAHATRAGYGATHYPIWSELSYFERDTLGKLHSAQNNDSDALLRLYLVSSGVRQSAEFETVRRRVDEFVEQARKRIIEERNPLLVGESLNAHMHQFFFLRESRDGAPNGYFEDQSRLMGIFETGEFNCISASLLYAVIARRFELDVKGVLLPSHAFIELDADGAAIDIETTSAHGFNQKHDEAFYQRANAEWFSSRGLQPATYTDYLNRERVNPTILGARNMLNQHTAKDKMDADDSARLAEISAFIEPDNAMAQEKRLYFYNQEIHQLAQDQHWQTLERLFATTYARVITDITRLHDTQSMQAALQMYLSGAMLTYAHLGDVDRTLAVLGELLARQLRVHQEPGQQVEARITNAVSVLLSKLVERELFEDGVLVLSLIEGHLQDPKAWPNMTHWFYLRWAEHFWQQSKWQDVIDILSDNPGQPLQQDSERSETQDLLGSAYYNWVLTLTQNNEMEAAEAVLAQCRSGHSGHCSKAAKLMIDVKKATAKPKVLSTRESASGN